MDKIDEQYFETINGIQIRSSVHASANNLEILIENQRYSDERRRNIRHIFIIIFICMLLNAVIRPHSILIVLNSFFFATTAAKCYVLINLIRFGKENFIFKLSFKSSSLIKPPNYQIFFKFNALLFYFDNRKVAGHQRFELGIHDTILFRQEAYLFTNRMHS